MRKAVILIVVLLCVAVLASPATAQDSTKAEIFGGYQFTRVGGSGGINANGWNGAVTGKVRSWLGVTADFGGAYKSVAGVSVKAHTFLFGPVFSSPKSERVTPFVHVLFGGFHASAGFAGASAGTGGFAIAVGGGVDAKVTKHVAVRVMQADWLMWRAEGITEKKNARISTGLVFRF